jgi:TRAP transporter 4TM/12TM fusion protein
MRAAVERWLGTALSVCAVAWALGLAPLVGLDLYDEQYAAFMLALALGLAFVHFRINGDTDAQAPWPWYDQLMTLAALSSTGYLAWQYPNIVDVVLLRPWDAVLAGTVIIALLLEGLRRCTGRVLPVLVSVFLLYALVAQWVPGALQGKSSDWPKLAAYLSADVNGMLGLPLKIGTTVVITFVLFGHLLTVTQASNWFTDMALTLMGRFRGGAAKIAVLASALFGSISGSAVANVVATGVVTIPMIKRSGYRPEQAGAIEAVASTGGQLMPPVMGASAFLMAEFLQISYGQVVMAALIPAVLYYLALFIQVDLDAARLGLDRVPESEIPKFREVLPGFYFLLPFVVLVMALFNLNWSAELASLLGAAVLVVLALMFGHKGVRPRWGQLWRTLAQTGTSVIDIVLITAAAGLVIGVLSISGLGFNLTLSLVTLGAGSQMVLLLLAALVCVILGMGLPTVGVYVLLATLVAPALVEVGVHPMAAHLFVMYFGMMSMITPPVAIAAYAAAGLAQADPLRTGMASVRLGWSAYIVPFLFVLSPALIAQGEPQDIAMACITATLGIAWVSFGVVGFFRQPLQPILRLAFVAAGLLAMVPAQAFPGAVWTDAAGVVLGVLLMIACGLKTQE